jgi:hypothetical protein
MISPKAKCRRYITIFFVVLITFLISNLYYEFKYLDFAYLVVIVVGFIRFLGVKENE